MILTLAFALRVLGVERVLPPSGDVVFAFGDPYYHLRLALYSLTRFPDFLQYDSYLHHPFGAHVPWPPLYDLLVAGSARLVGGGVRTLELIAAWWPPLLGTLTTLAVHRAGRIMAGRLAGLLAALVHALLPASAVVSRVGYADHHAAVAWLGATWLALQLASLRRPHLGLAAALAAVRAALVLTWSGSLAYLGIAEVAFVVAGLLAARPRPLALEAGSLAATALLLSPVAAITEGQLGGPFATLEFSWLHVIVCGTLAVWAAGCASLQIRRARTLARVLGSGASAALLLAGIFALPGVPGGAQGALDFLSRSDLWGAASPEQVPLFSGSGSGVWAWYLFGGLGFALPLIPFALLGLAVARRDVGFVLLAGWTGAFGAMALAQVRFANDLAPSASVACAVLLLEILLPLARRRPGLERATPLGAALVVLALLAPTIGLHHLPGLGRTLAAREALTPSPSPEGSFLEFAKQVRRVTPETSGFLEPTEPAEYGVLADPSLGHVLHYVARRATPADNFGPYLGREGFEATLRLLLSPPRDSTFVQLRELSIRYVVTGWQPRWHRGSLLQRLHQRDGRAQDGRPALTHFRLVAEGPPGGVPLGALGPGGVPVPYKLFEVVPGARVLVGMRPGENVRARVALSGMKGRRFVHRIDAVADESGCAALRLPYATTTEAPVRPEGPYRVDLGGAEVLVDVSERDVREGALLTLPGDSSESGGAGPAC